MAQLTVLGASGYIGSHLVTALLRQGHAVSTPGRREPLTGTALGTVIDCVGLTGDFRSRPYDTVEAHVCHLSHVLQCCRFDRLVYLSSARLYLDAPGDASEEAALSVQPLHADDLYNLSKALGEAVALHSGRPTCVVRLSNVYGDDWTSNNFLPSIIKAALRDRVVTLHTDLQSCKDYVYIDDLIDVLIRIVVGGTERIYNIASGRNVSHRELLGRLAQLCGCTVRTVADAPRITFPRIAIARVQREFGFSPRCLLDELPRLVATYQLHRREWN